MPLKRTTADWIALWRDNRYWWGREELARYHNELHMQFGSEPNDAIIEVEQEMSMSMRSSGLEHRHSDTLAEAAGTVVDEQVDPSIPEVQAYLASMVLDSRAIEFVQDSDGGPIAVVIRGGILKGMESQLVKAINRQLPPGIEIKMLSKNAKGSFAVATAAYRLELGREFYSEPIITTWDVMVAHLRTSAAAASSVFKEDQDPSVPFRVIKQAEEEAEHERIVTGVVLQPEVIDKTDKNPDGSDTGAVGDIYSEEEILKAMYWWMENADMTFSYEHIALGGQMLMKEEVKVLENFRVRKSYKEGDQDIPKGSWVMTVRVNNDALWDAILKGDIKSWSIGAHALGQIEEIEEAA
jgi:hypothetical protein